MQNSSRYKLITNPYFFFGVATFIGFTLRLLIGKNISFWTDEGQYIFVTSIKNIFELRDYINHNSSCDQPVLMYFLVYAWKSLFGIAPAILKLLPLFFTTISIFITGALCLRVTQNRFISYFLTLWITFSPLSIRYSYDVTPYGILSFFAPISFFFFLNLIKKKNFLPDLSLILVNIIMMNLHYYAFFSVTAQMLIFFGLIIKNREYSKLKNYFLICFIYFLSAALPMLILLQPFRAYQFQDWIAIVGQSFHEITLGSLGLYKTIAYILEAIWVGVVGWFFIIQYDKNDDRHRTFVYAAVFYLITIAVIETVQLFTWKFFGHYRYLMILFPLLLFIPLIAIDQIPNKKLKYGIAILIAALFMADVQRSQPAFDQDFDGAFRYMWREEKNAPFAIFFLPQGVNKPLSYYYANYYKLNAQIILDNLFILQGDTQEIERMVQAFRSNNVKNIYFIHYFVNGRQKFRDRLLEQFAPYFSIETEREFKDIHLYKMNLKAPDQTQTSKLKKKDTTRIEEKLTTTGIKTNS